jgi:hypothetical protein
MLQMSVKAVVPEDRLIVIELPSDTPVGPIRLTITEPTDVEEFEVVIPEDVLRRLPSYVDPVTGERKSVGRSGVVREIRTSPTESASRAP